jgi:hypothetical protein
LDASAVSPPARQRRRHTYAEFDETSNRRATSGASGYGWVSDGGAVPAAGGRALPRDAAFWKA